jgi:cbb3-type cytochrome oxidase maturation protein
MSVVFILVFVAIIMAGAFLIAFVWAVKSGQYEDTYTPSVRILFDDLEIKESENSQKITKEKGKKEKQKAISV